MAKTMRTERKLNKFLSAAGSVLVVLSVLLMSVLSVPAAEESGSLTLRSVFSVGDGRRVLTGDEYSLVKIADASFIGSSARYTTRELFSSYDCDWDRLSASNLNAKARALASYCEKNGYYTDSELTDTFGECRFDDLEIGLYLAARTKTDPANRDFITEPLLFFLPQNVNGENEYSVVATPKFSYSDPGTSPGDDGRRLPQTGQLLWPVTLLAVLGCLLILVGSFLFRKEERGEE